MNRRQFTLTGVAATAGLMAGKAATAKPALKIALKYGMIGGGGNRPAFRQEVPRRAIARLRHARGIGAGEGARPADVGAQREGAWGGALGVGGWIPGAVHGHGGVGDDP